MFGSSIKTNPDIKKKEKEGSSSKKQEDKNICEELKKLVEERETLEKELVKKHEKNLMEI